jgi:hypothetical protein
MSIEHGLEARVPLTAPENWALIENEVTYHNI